MICAQAPLWTDRHMLSSLRASFLRRSASSFRRTGVRGESTTATPQPPSQKARRYPWLTPTMILVGVMPFFTFALGTWQVQRLKWKVNLIDELEEKLRREPLMLPPRIKCVRLRFQTILWSLSKLTGSSAWRSSQNLSTGRCL